MMKGLARERVKIDRVACPWLIGKLVDPRAKFLFVPPEQVGERAARELAVIAEGFRHLDLKDDHEIVARQSIVYDALYAYCQHRVAERPAPPRA